MIGEQFLLLPGPTPLPDRISYAMSKPMINHRGSEFKEILEEVTAGVKKFCCTNQNLLIYPSSGTGGLEAAIVNFISSKERVLAVSIGVFGDRFAEIAREFGAIVDKIQIEHGQAVDPQQIREYLQKDIKKEVKAVLITHNETSTGVYNDIKLIKEAMGDHPALLIVDAVSSLAVLELKMDEWGLDVLVSGSQKAFMIPPGLSFIAFNEKALQAHKACTNSKYYWDISTGLKYLKKGQTAFTPAISLYFGLREALKMMEEEGLERIISRHASYRYIVRESVKAMGLKLLAEDNCASPALTSVIAPESIGSKQLCLALQQKFNIIMAGGQQNLDNVIFRIGHLGFVRELDLLSVLAAIEISLVKLGHKIELGVGVKKAQEILLNKY